MNARVVVLLDEVDRCETKSDLSNLFLLIVLESAREETNASTTTTRKRRKKNVNVKYLSENKAKEWEKKKRGSSFESSTRESFGKARKRVRTSR